MSDKYEEIFNQVLDTAEGDALTRFTIAASEMKLAILRDSPVWMKFNMLSWMIGNKSNDTIDWKHVNELLKSNNEYDFNAFDYIDSVEKFAIAAADSKVASINFFNQPFVKRVCKDCGEEYTLNIGQVQFYCKKEWPLPKKCDKCLAIKKGESASIKPKEKDSTYTPGFSQPLNGFAEALKKAGLKVNN